MLGNTHAWWRSELPPSSSSSSSSSINATSVATSSDTVTAELVLCPLAAYTVTRVETSRDFYYYTRPTIAVDERRQVHASRNHLVFTYVPNYSNTGQVNPEEAEQTCRGRVRIFTSIEGIPRENVDDFWQDTKVWGMLFRHSFVRQADGASTDRSLDCVLQVQNRGNVCIPNNSGVGIRENDELEVVMPPNDSISTHEYFDLGVQPRLRTRVPEHQHVVKDLPRTLLPLMSKMCENFTLYEVANDPLVRREEEVQQYSRGYQKDVAAVVAQVARALRYRDNHYVGISKGNYAPGDMVTIDLRAGWSISGE